MVFFNIAGAIIAIGSGVIVWGSHWVMSNVGIFLSDKETLFFVLLSWQLLSSMIALTWDRCDLHGFWRAYHAGVSQVYLPALGQPLPPGVQWNPYRRTAVFVWPLAFSPLVGFTIAAILWIVDILRHANLMSEETHAVSIATSAILVAIAWGFAMLTRKLRLCKSFEIPPASTAEPSPPTIVGKIAQAVQGNDTAASPTRRPAFMLFVFGVFCLAFNHYLFVSEGKGHFGFTFLGPLLFFFGLGGIIDPRIIWSRRAEGQIYPKWIRLTDAMLLVVSMATAAFLAIYVYL